MTILSKIIFLTIFFILSYWQANNLAGKVIFGAYSLWLLIVFVDFAVDAVYNILTLKKR